MKIRALSLIHQLCRIGTLTKRLKRNPAHINLAPRPGTTRNIQATFCWENECILFLMRESGALKLAKSLSERGATVSFGNVGSQRDLYELPLEQYSMVIMGSPSEMEQTLEVTEIGGILRCADPDIIRVWASEKFTLSQVADSRTSRFCDIHLALPALADQLELFLDPLKQSRAFEFADKSATVLGSIGGKS